MAIDVGRTSSISEAELMAGYDRDEAVLELKLAGKRMARRPCVCRGIVTADIDNPTPGVASHNDTFRHQVWRAERA